jgi:hypothetical protein
VDITAPTITFANAGPPVLARVTPGNLTFTYAAVDNTAVVGYDLFIRTATPGSGLGTWRQPAEWQQTQQTSVTSRLRVGAQSCLKVRAADRAGNPSAWSPTRCVTIPYDDRALTPVGAITRATSPLALAGTVTRLDEPGAALRRTGLTGRAVALEVLRGPGQGKVSVYVGSRRLGSIALSAPSRRRELVTLWSPSNFNGTVSVRSTSRRPARIDALAVLR